MVAPRLLCPWDSPGKNTGVLPFPFPGGLPHPGTEPRSSHCRQILDHLSHCFSLSVQDPGVTKTTVISALKVAALPGVPQSSESRTVSRPLLSNTRMDSDCAHFKDKKTETQGVGIIG